MLKEEHLELLSSIAQFIPQPFQKLHQPVLMVYLDTGPRWSDPALVLANFQVSSLCLLESLSKQQNGWQKKAANEFKRVQPLLEKFLYSSAREAGLLVISAEWANLLEVEALPSTPVDSFYFDNFLYLEYWLELKNKTRQDAINWIRVKKTTNRQTDPAFIQRLGYGVLDLERGNWSADRDIAALARYEHSPHFYARQLLKLLGKRFPDSFAPAVWEAIAQYQQEQRNQFSSESLEYIAQEWYQKQGIKFIKDWYFGPNCPKRHYLSGTGHEWEPGLYTRLLCRIIPILAPLSNAGFKFAHIFQLIKEYPLYTFKGFSGKDESFWPWLVASLTGFPLTTEQLLVAVQEIKLHAFRLNFFKTNRNRPLALCSAAVDYFQRLEIAGLGPEVFQELEGANLKISLT